MAFGGKGKEQVRTSLYEQGYNKGMLKCFEQLPGKETIVARFNMIVVKDGQNDIASRTQDVYVTAYQSSDFNLDVVNDLMEALGKPTFKAGEEIALPEMAEMDESWMEPIEIYLTKKKEFFNIPTMRISNNPIFRPVGQTQENSSNSQIAKLLGK